MRIKMFELYQRCMDKALKCKVTITHAYIDADGVKGYRVTPEGQNSKNKDQLMGLYVTRGRLQDPKVVEIDVPMELLHTKAKDFASGISGTIIQLVIHPGGCIHAHLVPDGRTENNEFPDGFEVDIRRLRSPLIKKLTDAERKASEQKTPSPVMSRMPVPGRCPSMPL